ncbi:uncharacterized protein METZ01_LOCUS505958, partial [marine metagenome]
SNRTFGVLYELLQTNMSAIPALGFYARPTRTSRTQHKNTANKSMKNRDCMKSHVELSKPDLNCANNQFQNHKKFQCSTPNISEVMVDLRFPIVIHKGKSCLCFTAEIDMGRYDTERGLDGDGFPCLVLGYGPTHSQRRPPERATTMCHRAPNSFCSLVFILYIYMSGQDFACLW